MVQYTSLNACNGYEPKRSTSLFHRKDNDDGYEDEEFEDYDEDFEDDEQEAPPKKPAYVEPPAPAKQAKVVNNPYNNPSNNHFSSRDEPSAPKPAATR